MLKSNFKMGRLLRATNLTGYANRTGRSAFLLAARLESTPTSAAAVPAHSKQRPQEAAMLYIASEASKNTLRVDQAPLSQREKLAAYFQLAKPELSALVITTGTWGFLLTGCGDIVAGVSTVSGLVLSAASAAAWNQTSEREHDKKMVRTRNRPLPSGKLTTGQAAGFSAATGATGVSLLTFGANPLTGALGLANIVLYGLAYTPMKRFSEYNTHVGAVVGALPVVVGWTGGAGALESVEPLVLFSILYAWQFPHFMGIAYKYRHDYKNAGYKMVTRDDKGAVRTSYWANCGAAALCAIPFMSYGVGMTSSMFIVSSAIPNAVLLHVCNKFARRPSGRTANRLIGFGFVYLMIFLGLMFFHSTSEALEQHIDSVRNVLRNVGRQLCVHEIKLTDVPELCPVEPKTTAEKYIITEVKKSKTAQRHQN